MIADLHCHSNNSDGKLPVSEVIKRAYEKNINVIALTDHDSVMGLEEAQKECDKYNIKLILGLELSTWMNGESVHLLGYFLNEIPEGIVKYSKELYESRRSRARLMMENIKNMYGLDLDVKRVMAWPGMVTRSHMLDEITRVKPELSRNEAFKLYLTDDNPAYIKAAKLSTLEGIKFLHDEGAFISLAHPTLLKNTDPEDIIKLGVNAIEARYPRNKEGDEARFRVLAKKYNLCITAGSDFHFVGDPAHGDLCCNPLEEADLNIFLERILDHENSKK